MDVGACSGPGKLRAGVPHGTSTVMRVASGFFCARLGAIGPLAPGKHARLQVLCRAEFAQAATRRPIWVEFDNQFKLNCRECVCVFTHQIVFYWHCSWLLGDSHMVAWANHEWLQHVFPCGALEGHSIPAARARTSPELRLQRFRVTIT